MDTSAVGEKSSVDKIAEEKFSEETPITSESIMSAKGSLHDSEYESVDSGDNYSDDGREHQHHSGDSGNSGSDSEDGSVILEREEGDGQESLPSKKVDDDQDKKNPQYIPKRGTFYEHDDRTADDGDNPDAVEEGKSEKDGKKKVWQDKKERWSHDKFIDDEQAPKSRAELVSIYGYDIRNEDGPPRARRRRRYGRGPNKYTRNWEDEDAYTKTVVSTKKKGPRNTRSKQDSENESEVNTDAPEVSRQPVQKPPTPTNPPQPNRNSFDNIQQNNKPEQIQQENSRNNAPQPDKYHSNRGQPRAGTGRIVKPPKEIKDSDYRGFTRSRQFKNTKVDQQKIQNRNERRMDKPDYVPSQNFSNKNMHHGMQEIEKDMSKMSVQENNYKNRHSNNNSQRQASMPPRLQGEQKGSKRYSSMRQRSLPETANPPLNIQHPNYYPGDYPQQSQPPQQQLIQHQGAPLHATPPQMPQIAPPPLAPLPQQVPVTTTPILQAPPQFAPPFPQAPPYLPATVAPPPFMDPQIINYAQPQFPQPAYPEYQQQFNPVVSTEFTPVISQPTEIFNPTTGITYYNPQQQSVQRPAPQKRPKAAIPIVAPPPIEPRGRGRANATEIGCPNNGSENNDSNTRIVEQEESSNFEDAAISVQQ